MNKKGAFTSVRDLFLPKTKKGALSIELIIVAALCLVVLIVLAGLFTNTIGEIMKKIFGIEKEATPVELKRSCTYQGGHCTTVKDCSNTIIPAPSEGWKGICNVCCKS